MRKFKERLTQEAAGKKTAPPERKEKASFEEVRRRVAQMTKINPPYARLLQEVKKYDQQTEPPGRLFQMDYCR